MNSLSRAPLLALACAAVLGSNTGVVAQAVDDHVAAREALRRGEILSLSRVLAIVQAAAPGDVVLVRLIHQEYGWRYRVRVLTVSGQLRLVRIDARTGRIIEIVDE